MSTFEKGLFNNPITYDNGENLKKENSFQEIPTTELIQVAENLTEKTYDLIQIIKSLKDPEKLTTKQREQLKQEIIRQKNNLRLVYQLLTKDKEQLEQGMLDELHEQTFYQ